nr:hypothetical transcript [Hymenolepis microstoma]
MSVCNTSVILYDNKGLARRDPEDPIVKQIQLGLLMSYQGQIEPLPFETVFSPDRREHIQKIGLGLHSEVFGFTNENVAVKLVPFGGDKSFHSQPQMTISEVCTELEITEAISNLQIKDDSESSSPNLVNILRVTVLQGQIPQYLIDAKCNCKIPIGLQFIEKIDEFPVEQLWVALEFTNSGEALTNNWPSCGKARLSVLAQAALALAVGERRLQMEHRDLHLGNVLINRNISSNVKECEHLPPRTFVDGVAFQPLDGPTTCIVDFACARLQNHNRRDMSVCNTSVILYDNKGLARRDPEDPIVKQIQLGLLMSYQGQIEPLPFETVFSPDRREHIQKIGLGLHSEVFGFTNENVAVKLVPFGGDKSFHSQPQMTISEVCTELEITEAISNLQIKDDSESSSPNLVNILRVTVLQGQIPQYLIDAKCNCKIPIGLQFIEKIDEFPVEQLWVALEFTNSGEALTNNWPSCGKARLSVLAQAALALAVGERRLQMEHRDLHLGNVLINRNISSNVKECEHLPPRTFVDGVAFQPLDGPTTCIVDFACARLQNQNFTHFVDMTDKCKRVRIKDGPIGVMYGIMQDITDDQWNCFHPITNVYWLTFLALWLLDSDKVHNCDIHSNFNLDLTKQLVTHFLGKCSSALEFIKVLKRDCNELLFK